MPMFLDMYGPPRKRRALHRDVRLFMTSSRASQESATEATTSSSGSESASSSSSEAEASSSTTSSTPKAKKVTKSKASGLELWPVTPYHKLAFDWKENVKARVGIKHSDRAEKWFSKTFDDLSNSLKSSKVPFIVAHHQGRPTVFLAHAHVARLAALLRGELGKTTNSIVPAFEKSWRLNDTDLGESTSYTIARLPELVQKHESVALEEAKSANAERQERISQARAELESAIEAVRSDMPVAPAQTIAKEDKGTPAQTVDQPVAKKASEYLPLMRKIYRRSTKIGGATYLALDIEAWERDASIVTEFGYSSLTHENGDKHFREMQHLIVKEFLPFRNKHFAKNAREAFDFGRSLILPTTSVRNVVTALLDTLSATGPLFLILHDARSDLRFMKTFEIDTTAFVVINEPADLEVHFDKHPRTKGVFVIDSQTLFAEHAGIQGRRTLEHCARTLGVDLEGVRLHNAGNDAVVTLKLFEALMSKKLAVTSSR